MGIRRFNEVFDDLAWWFDDVPSISFGRNVQWIDPQKYDVVPKKEYKQILIKNQEQEIADIKTKLAEAEDKLKALKSG
jgi:hypothetical protein